MNYTHEYTDFSVYTAVMNAMLLHQFLVLVCLLELRDYISSSCEMYDLDTLKIKLE